MALPPDRKVAERVRYAADVAWNGWKVFRLTGLLGALRPSGLKDFVKSIELRGRRGGPAVVMRLHACNTPDKLALVDGAVRLSYRELYQRICRLAHGLVRLGCGPGDHVAVMLPNCHQYLEAQAAIATIGATVVQVGYRLKAGEVGYILENSRARVLLAHSEYLAIAHDAAGRAGLAASAVVAVGGADDGYEAVLATGDPARPPVTRGTSQGGVMVYTSGTTGKPKGAQRDFEQTGMAEALHFIQKFPLSHDDRHLVACPLYHSAAPAFVSMVFGVGGSNLLVQHFDPEAILALIQRERITCSMMVPTMLGRLVQLAPEVRARYDVSSLRWLMSGAAPLPTEVARGIEAWMGPILYNFYGATETGLVTVALPGEHTARPGTIGRAIEGNDIRLLRDGREVGPGEVGELWVRNGMLVGGYYRNQEATKEASRDGFFFAGDLARKDADGYFYLADRKSDMVISGGVNIYPLEIEQHLHAHPAVADVAVVGVPDPDWGESLRAFVVLRAGAGASEDELRRYCKDALADYKCPRRFEFIDVLPRNPTGKVLKRELRLRP